MDENEDVLFKFSTLYYYKDAFNDPNTSKMVPIYPSANSIWTFQILSTFLNELSDFTLKSHPIYANQQEEVIFHFVSCTNISYEISVSISTFISVFVSKSWLLDTWNAITQTFISYLGSRNYILKYPRVQEHIQFTKIFDRLSNGSKSLLYKKDLLYNSKFDFSKIFHYFCKKIRIFGLPMNDQTSFIFNYLDSFCKITDSTKSFEDLKNLGMKGYFKLTLQPKIVKKKLQSFFYQNSEYYILSGVYILPQSFTLFQNNFHYNGFVLDTTWRIIPYYVVSILTVNFLNTSLPIGYVFGHGETAKSYTFLLKTVEKKLNISFQNKTLESDQGKALQAVCQAFNMKHLACLRHLLCSLKKYDYFYEISFLLKCASDFELKNCIQNLSQNFFNICFQNPPEYTKINQILGKIGLFFSGYQFYIENDNRWEEVSMHRRIKYGMPSTTNTLEAMHGHLNKRTPRNNTFFRALLRINKNLNAKYSNIFERITHNYSYIKKVTLNKLQKYDNIEMNNMCEFYKTTEDHCECSDNKLVSANFGFDIPCCHRLFKGATFNELPNFQFTFQNFEDLEFEYEFEPAEINRHQKGYDEMDYCARTIKHFSKYPDDNEIKQYVADHRNDNLKGFYILNQKVSVIQLIEEGIFFFKKKKRMLKNNNNNNIINNNNVNNNNINNNYN